jgi:hypothetical protein
VLIAAPRLSLVQVRALGTIGALAVAAGGSFAGSLPVGGPQLVALRTRIIGDTVDPAVVCVYVGLTLLVVAWWRLGRLLTSTDASTGSSTHAGITRRGLLITLASWSAPLLFCPPLFSRDVYSYLAQGAMVRAGIDIYSHGPDTLGGPLAAEVPAIWQDTPAPYGPVFVLYATAIAHLVGSHTVLGVFAMRAVALAGVAALAVCLPWLARRFGASPTKALWLGVLNPLVLLHLVAGAHNDAVMLALLAAGLAATTAGRRVLGVTLIAMAALVKVPAVVGLLFVVPLWAAHSPGRWREVKALLGTGAVAAGTTLVVTALAGTGFGWIHALGTPASPSNWSLTSALARVTARFLDMIGVGVAADVLELWRWVGLCVAVVVAAGCWWQRERLGPVRALGIALGAIVLLGPALRPWYLLWAVVLLAATTLPRRPLYALAGSCGVLALVVLPNGFAPDSTDIGHAVLGVAMAVGALLVASALADREDWPLDHTAPVPQPVGAGAGTGATAYRVSRAYQR